MAATAEVGSFSRAEEMYNKADDCVIYMAEKMTDVCVLV